jgi:outer membrane protein OmpA-like peptidoglycan-associated protein
MRFVKSAVFALALISTSAVLGSTEASAQGKGFALDRFDPAERGSDWFVLDSLDLRGHFRPAAGITGDWGYKPLVLYDAAGNEKSDIVEHQIFAHLGGSLVLWDRVRAGLSLPIALYQTGDGPTVKGQTFSVPSTDVGDLRLSADVRLLGGYGDVFNSAIGFALYFPTGSREQFTGDGNARFSPRVSVAGDISMVSYAARLGLNYRPLTEKLDTSSLGTELTIAASAGVRVLDRKLLVGPEIYGSTVADSFFEKRATPLEWLIGGHYTVSDFKFGAGIGSGLTRGWGAPVVRTVLSAEWAPGIDKDSDGDHILDREDACPTVPGVRTNDPRTNGCPPPAPPPPPPDRDNDGIIDAKDACPDVPGVANVDPAKNGCPPDQDNDGIFDSVDACPTIPGVKSDDPAKNGCPPDRDNDGIYDADDACPDVPGVKSEDPKKNGCPPDRDGDGILDPVDACPDAPGPADPDPKKNGCPLARIENGEVKIIEQVKFKTGSSEILKESDSVLNAVATIMKDHPELQKVRVEGHTDNRGAAAMNKALSERRAASVVAWLTKAGIDKKRLSSKGFGLDRPIDSNETEEGRQNNRRVEFHIEPITPAPGPAVPAPKK